MLFLTAIVVGGAAAAVLRFDAQREQVKSVVTTIMDEQAERQNVRRQMQTAETQIAQATRTSDAKVAAVTRTVETQAAQATRASDAKVAAATRTAETQAAQVTRAADAKVAATTRTAKAAAKLEQHEREIVSLINRERSQRGIGTLTWDERLQSIAREHSRDMAEKDYFSHTNKSGLDYRARALAAGYRCPNPKWQGVAENLHFGTVGYQTPAAAVTNWLDSPLHKRAMLDPSFSKAAIGVHYGHLSGYGSGYYTTLLLC